MAGPNAAAKKWGLLVETLLKTRRRELHIGNAGIVAMRLKISHVKHCNVKSIIAAIKPS